MTELSERDLAYLTEIDHHDHEALAAIDPETGELVGVARYVRGAEPELAEVSVVVGDPWQRRGSRHAARAPRRARPGGRRSPTSSPWSWTRTPTRIKLFEHVVPGHARPRRSSSGHLELLIELPEPGAMPDSTLARVLRAVAHTAVVVNPYRVMRDAMRAARDSDATVGLERSSRPLRPRRSPLIRPVE